MISDLFAQHPVFAGFSACLLVVYSAYGALIYFAGSRLNDEDCSRE